MENKEIEETIFYKEYLTKFKIPFQEKIWFQVSEIWNIVNIDTNKLDFGDKDTITITLEKFIEKFDIEYIDEDFDWNLLIKLIAASFSSKMSIVLLYPKLPKICIDVESGDKKVTIYLDKLWGFQIARMFEIYLEETINLEIIKNEDEKEKKIVLSQRQKNIKKWQKEVERIKLYFEYLKGNQ